MKKVILVIVCVMAVSTVALAKGSNLQDSIKNFGQNNHGQDNPFNHGNNGSGNNNNHNNNNNNQNGSVKNLSHIFYRSFIW